jgi:hypothetical protein
MAVKTMRQSLLISLLSVTVVLVGGPASASASSGDVAATRTYVQANYATLSVAVSHLAISEAVPLHVLAQVKRECPGAGASSPQDPESTQMSDEVIGTIYIAAIQPDLSSIRAAVQTVSGLSWSDSALTHKIQAYTAAWRTMIGLSAPNLCGDVKAWAESGYKALPSTTTSFVPKFMAAWVGAGLQPPQLRRYESPATRALAEKSASLEQQIAEAEARAVEHWGEIMDTLDLWP